MERCRSLLTRFLGDAAHPWLIISAAAASWGLERDGFFIPQITYWLLGLNIQIMVFATHTSYF